ncbi:NUDIX hydrolase [Actinomadura harenae]|uniref:NUDIX domain-containing protein n=1 Tax=Actinomadura harenae TaxID=2483351 RepID=A0A3M2LHZ7_9ACTN|nr:NUDIX domain-containing protein [Actinomadura harenae]RMI37099.1 NUDIX domain-containing protein [Actinomadura harenae]
MVRLQGRKAVADRSLRHSVSVAGVVMDDLGRALLVQRRDNGHWEPPGGVLELEESVPDGLRREVLEETGLTVEPVGLTGVYKNMTRGIVALVFRCRVLGGVLSSNAEVKAFHWATRQEVTAMLDEAYAVRVLDAMDVEGASVQVRHHDGVRLLPEPPVEGPGKRVR